MLRRKKRKYTPKVKKGVRFKTPREYVCKYCGFIIKLKQWFDRGQATTCPKCGSDKNPLLRLRNGAPKKPEKVATEPFDRDAEIERITNDLYERKNLSLKGAYLLALHIVGERQR